MFNCGEFHQFPLELNYQIVAIYFMSHYMSNLKVYLEFISKNKS